MVKNKTELVAVASQWTETAKADIMNHTRAFMQRTGASVAQLADILDVDTATVEAMLNGTADIPMSLFAKILVGTGHVIVIMPENHMPHGGQCVPQPGTVGRGRRAPQPAANAPMRDARGRFAPRQTPHAPMPMMPPMGNPYAMPGMPYGGYPMPQPYGNMPSPEEVFNNAAPQPFDMAEMPDETDNGEMPPVEEPQTEQRDTTDPSLIALARALRENPDIANALRGLV